MGFVWQINSILQALAGLEDLRTYLSQRTTAAKQQRGENCENELLIDRKPFLTAALKEILDSRHMSIWWKWRLADNRLTGLNERPIYRKKTISNRPFLNTLEKVFMRRISRAQQDAHEFLQVVAETLAEEHHRLKKLERQGKVRAVVGRYSLEDVTELGEEMVIINGPEPENEEEQKNEEADFVGMPLEGRMVSEIECQKCGFKPKPTVSSFVVLTLPVPQKVCHISHASNRAGNNNDGPLCRTLLPSPSALRALSRSNTSTTSPARGVKFGMPLPY